MSVRSHISETTCPNFIKFSVHIHCGCGASDDSDMMTWFTSSSVDDVMFSHNGTYAQNDNQHDWDSLLPYMMPAYRSFGQFVFGQVHQVAAPVSGHAARFCLLLL